jgi:hypothetical protein
MPGRVKHGQAYQKKKEREKNKGGCKIINHLIKKQFELFFC